MENNIRDLPACLYGNSKRWVCECCKIRKTYRLYRYKCACCGQVACDLIHEYGNAFVLSRRYTRFLSNSATDYIYRKALPLFEYNARALRRRQLQVEDAWLSNCRVQFHLKPADAIWNLSHIEYAAFIGRISWVYTTPDWQHPPGFDFSPVPPAAPRELLVRTLRTTSDVSVWKSAAELVY